MAHKSLWYWVGVSSIFPSLTCLFSLLMGIRPKVKRKETKQNKIKSTKITFCSPAKTTSSAPCKSHMTKSHDTHAHDWWKGKWKGGGVTWKIQNIKKNYTNMERVKTKKYKQKHKQQKENKL